MKRAALIAAIAAAAGVLAGTAGAADTGGVRVIEAKGPAFPVRTFVLTLPGDHKLTIHDVSVKENGSSVVTPTLVPASQAAKKTFGVVLVLDASYSMTGKPLAAAIKAEQAFAAQRNPKEQLGEIEFNRDTTVSLPLTTSDAKIAAAMGKPPVVTTGTHIYDAVAQAEAMLASADIGSGSIVLLSDGADTGSTKTLSEVAGSALNSNTKIYTVGLADQSYKPGTLKALAAAGHGEYAQAKAQDLEPLFHKLGEQLSNEYLLQYKSLAGPNVPVHVDVNVTGFGTASTGYRTPALPVSNMVPAPYKPSIGSRIAGSPITMIVVALLVAAVIAFLVIGLLQPKRSGLPARMAEFVSIRGLQRDKGQATAVPADEANAAKPKNAWARFEETLEIAEIHVEPEMIVAGTFALTALSFLLIYAATGSVWWGLLALVIPYLAREWVVRTLARRRNRFAEQLPDALQVVASALRSGHSFAGALAVVVESASEPMKSEMQRVVAAEQRGVPIQDSLGVVAERMASRDVEQLALVAQLQREAGGDTAEVVDRVAETVRERFDLKRLIATLTMQGRMSRWIVSALPIVIVLAVLLENKHYFHPLISTLGGRIIIGFAVAWAVAGSFAIKKIVEIEV
ncbi:MAG TPA: type II secretion system F family protein [Gaiellaceae bacterium]|nr:type II secretion system F family protein [Gaiellaceae bacterium]